MNFLRAHCQRYRKQATFSGVALFLVAGLLSFHDWSLRQESRTVQGTITEWKRYVVKKPPDVVYRVQTISQSYRYWIWVEYLDHHADRHSKRFVGRESDQIGQAVTVEYHRADPSSARLTRNKIKGLWNGFLGLSLLWLAMGATGHWSNRRLARQKAADLAEPKDPLSGDLWERTT